MKYKKILIRSVLFLGLSILGLLVGQVYLVAEEADSARLAAMDSWAAGSAERTRFAEKYDSLCVQKLTLVVESKTGNKRPEHAPECLARITNDSIERNEIAAADTTEMVALMEKASSVISIPPPLGWLPSQLLYGSAVSDQE